MINIDIYIKLYYRYMDICQYIYNRYQTDTKIDKEAQYIELRRVLQIVLKMVYCAMHKVFNFDMHNTYK